MSRQEQSETNGARARALRTTRGVLIVALAGSSVFFAACGPDGRSLGDSDCPAQPLYRWEFDASTNVWSRIHEMTDGGRPLTQDELDAIDQARQHCLTAPGNATSIHENDAGTKTPVDAGKD